MDLFQRWVFDEWMRVGRRVVDVEMIAEDGERFTDAAFRPEVVVFGKEDDGGIPTHRQIECEPERARIAEQLDRLEVIENAQFANEHRIEITVADGNCRNRPPISSGMVNRF
jgi:hypothetical protein